jgi:hypothetical protein
MRVFQGLLTALAATSYSEYHLSALSSMPANRWNKQRSLHLSSELGTTSTAVSVDRDPSLISSGSLVIHVVRTDDLRTSSDPALPGAID